MLINPTMAQRMTQKASRAVPGGTVGTAGYLSGRLGSQEEQQMPQSLFRGKY